MDFARKFSELRLQHDMPQAELKTVLEKMGFPVTVQLISKWENGHSLPSLPQFFALCKIFNIYNPAEYFSDYWIPDLNSTGLRKVAEYRKDLIATGLYRPEIVSGRKRPLYLLPASAGTGQFLDSEDFETVNLPDQVPDIADFGIRIAGDSMEPHFHDGDNVWVQKSSTIENGEIGIFYLDGEAYIKKFRQDESGLYLVSLNTKYSPIQIMESSEFRVFGKVIG